MIHLLAAFGIALSSTPAFATHIDIPVEGAAATQAFLLLADIGAVDADLDPANGTQLVIRYVSCSTSGLNGCRVAIYQPGVTRTQYITTTQAQGQALVQLLSEADPRQAHFKAIRAEQIECGSLRADPESRDASAPEYGCRITVINR